MGEVAVGRQCNACGATFAFFAGHRCGESIEERDLRSQLASVNRELDERVDHETAECASLRHHLETATRERDQAREAVAAANDELHASVGLQRKLATAVEALEKISYTGRFPSDVVATRALAAIRAQEEK